MLGGGGGRGRATSTHPIRLETGPTWLYKVPKFCPRPTAACLCVHAASARSEGGMAGRLRRKTTTTTMMQQHCESLPGASQNRLAGKSIKATPPPPPPILHTSRQSQLWLESCSCKILVAAAQVYVCGYKNRSVAGTCTFAAKTLLLQLEKQNKKQHMKRQQKYLLLCGRKNLVVNLQLCTKATCDN